MLFRVETIPRLNGPDRFLYKMVLVWLVRGLSINPLWLMQNVAGL